MTKTNRPELEQITEDKISLLAQAEWENKCAITLQRLMNAVKNSVASLLATPPFNENQVALNIEQNTKGYRDSQDTEYVPREVRKLKIEHARDLEYHERNHAIAKDRIQLLNKLSESDIPPEAKRSIAFIIDNQSIFSGLRYDRLCIDDNCLVAMDEAGREVGRYLYKEVADATMRTLDESIGKNVTVTVVVDGKEQLHSGVLTNIHPQRYYVVLDNGQNFPFVGLTFAGAPITIKTIEEAPSGGQKRTLFENKNANDQRPFVLERASTLLFGQGFVELRKAKEAAEL